MEKHFLDFSKSVQSKASFVISKGMLLGYTKTKSLLERLNPYILPDFDISESSISNFLKEVQKIKNQTK